MNNCNVQVYLKSHADSNQWKQASRRLFGGNAQHLLNCLHATTKLTKKQSRAYILIKNDCESLLDDTARVCTNIFKEIEGIPPEIVYFKNPVIV